MTYEDYRRGYKAGYQAGAKKNPKKNVDMSRLTNIIAIPPLIKWLHIEGDEEHHICSNCKTSFEWYEPFKFCPECGGRSEFADMRGDNK